MNPSIHNTELPDDLLFAMGFEKKQPPYLGVPRLCWCFNGKFMHQMRTPGQVAHFIREVGREETIKKAAAFFNDFGGWPEDNPSAIDD